MEEKGEREKSHSAQCAPFQFLNHMHMHAQKDRGKERHLTLLSALELYQLLFDFVCHFRVPYVHYQYLYVCIYVCMYVMVYTCSSYTHIHTCIHMHIFLPHGQNRPYAKLHARMNRRIQLPAQQATNVKTNDHVRKSHIALQVTYCSTSHILLYKSHIALQVTYCSTNHYKSHMERTNK
jgi:hypothetical protein